jgi:diguanylate cyclase (GGDEF)-like protein
MRVRRERKSLIGRMSLTHQVALLSLLPMLALGLILARVLQTQIVARTLADATRSAGIIAHIGIQPRLTPKALRDGLTPAGVRALDQQLSARSVTQDLARVKIWNARHEVIYSDDHRLIGRTLTPSDDLLNALAGKPDGAEVVTPTAHSETASEVGLGKLVEVYVPLRFHPGGPPQGVFEIYLSYRPIASAVSRDEQTIALLVAIGLALLWAILYRIVARASSRLRRQADENDRLARYDQLTGLPNRNLFLECLAEAVSDEVGGRDSVAVLLLDLDRFTETNNTLGVANGDRVLCEVAARLRDELGPETLVARLGADEYAVMCPRADGSAGALSTAQAIQARLERPIVLEGVALNVEASIGIAVTGEHAESADALLQHADAALSHARSYCTRIEVYSPERDSFDADRLRLLGQVRGALEHDELILHYQPKVDLATRTVTGVEALVRWRHPERGLLAPPSFIPLIEQTALIGPLTQHVIDRALGQMVVWRRRGISLDMSVNLSARNLLDVDLPAKIAALLRRHAIEPQRLIVEVTESASMVDPERAVSVLEALRASGVGVSVDDFGTGNASIEYLTTLPADEIKIDRSFITDILQDRRSEAIVRSTIDLARNLELTVVAEGIETDAVMEHLTALGCEVGQGYFISRPLAGEEMTAWLVSAFTIPPERAGAERVTRAGGATAASRSAL